MSSNAPLSPDDRLQWAQRYLLGELSSVEAEAFEARLGEDEELAAALADVVLIHQAVGDVPLPAPLHDAGQDSRRLLRRFGWSVAAVAMVGVVALVQQTPRPMETAKGGAGAGLELSRPEVIDSLFASETEEGMDPLSVDPPEEEIDALDVPDWLFAAVEAEGRIDDSGRPQEEEL